jgi:single-stranded-DNA-specific exonuclease
MKLSAMYKKCQLPCEWVYPFIDEKQTALFVKEFMIHPIIAQILTARGFKDCQVVHDYLYAQLPNLFSPHRLADMEKATNRIQKALKRSEKILIYGDNDVDGITATALLVDFLRKLGAQTHFFIASRNQLTQSVLTDALDFAKKKNCSLVITVDCGITAAQEIMAFSEQKIDVIVTDHHSPTAKIPHCVATLNPKLITDTYPNKDLTGVGVAFKLAHALTNLLVSNGSVRAAQIDLKTYLDLVALGTIADMGSVLGENRILVRYGLKQLKAAKRIGLKHLFNVCGITASELTSNDIVLKIAPRINSLGRIANPLKGVELLLAKDSSEAEALACELDLNNKARQEIEQSMIEHLDALLEAEPLHLSQRGIVLASDRWHTGIIPLLCTRISRKYNRPCAVIAIEGELGKGSLRSIRELPILEPLKKMKELFVNFGGHDYAAGITIECKHIEAFRQKFQQLANCNLSDHDIAPKISLDAPLNFRDINFDLIESLDLLEPYGLDNPPPLFFAPARQAWLPKPFKRNHLKLYLEQEEIILEAMAFNMSPMRHVLMKKNLPLKIAFTPQLFHSHGSSRMQLIVREFISLG